MSRAAPHRFQDDGPHTIAALAIVRAARRHDYARRHIRRDVAA